MFEAQENFFGKDPIRWWIGQVTDPKKGKWGDSLEKKRAKDGADIYGFRCRVRIVGYHGSDSDLKDEDLPMAHILLPPNTTTTGGCGGTVKYQGGEVVVGFFADGDDAQQPIIFGTLFKQSYVADRLTTEKFTNSPFTDFTPYTPPKVKQDSGKHRFSDLWLPRSPQTIVMADGESKIIRDGVEISMVSQAQKQKEFATNITVAPTIPCEDNEISKISNAIKDFTRKLQVLEELNEAQTYIDPTFGGIIDIQEEIQRTTNKVHDSMTMLVRRGRSWLIQETFGKLSKTLEEKTAKPLQAPAGQAAKTLSDVIFCNLEKIVDQLKDYLSKSLENMVGQVVDVPICGVENFMSDMFGQINGVLDNSLGSIYEQLNNINGGGIALPSETFTKAIKFANIITNVLDCDNLNCAEPQEFSSKNGVTKSIEDSFENIIDKAGLSALVDPSLDDIDNAIDAEPSRPDCNTNVLKCGPPRVDFIGGGGQGASGSAIVNALGQIIGVSINGSGFGFEEPPLLSFFDSCDKGYGAGGYPVMGPVSKITEGAAVSVDGAGGVQVRSNGLLISVGGTGGLPVLTSDGKTITVDGNILLAGSVGGRSVKAGSIGGIPILINGVPLIVNGKGGKGLSAGGFPLVIGATNVGVGANAGSFSGLNITIGGESDENSLYVPDPNGTELGVVDVVIVDPGQEYLPNTTETDIDGNVKELVPDPNESYDGESSYVTSLSDVVVANAGYAYEDGDTVTVDDDGNVQVELKVENGHIVGTKVVNGGFGFTDLPELTINSETGFGGQLRPVLKFTKVEDASRLVDTDTPFDRNLDPKSVITVIDCIHK